MVHLENINDVVFITDSHIQTVSNVRTGDVVQDLKQKFKFVIEMCDDL